MPNHAALSPCAYVSACAWGEDIDRRSCPTLAERMTLATHGELPCVAIPRSIISMHGETTADIATHGEPRRLLSVDDVSALLGVTRRYVYQMLYAGQLESVKLGRRRLVPADSVDALVARLRAEARSKPLPRPAQPPSRPPAQPAPASPPPQPPRREAA